MILDTSLVVPRKTYLESPIDTIERDNIFAHHVPGSLVLNDSGDLALHNIKRGIPNI